jgi:hypothetical protein
MNGTARAISCSPLSYPRLPVALDARGVRCRRGPRHAETIGRLTMQAISETGAGGTPRSAIDA